MSMLPIGFGDSAGVYTGDIGHSLRCRASASAYLNRTFGAPTDNKKWTYSCWYKRGILGVNTELFGQYTDANNRSGFYIDTNNNLNLYQVIGGTSSWTAWVTSALFRDITSHMHFQVVYDSNNAAAGDRIKMYINGVRLTSFSAGTNPSLSQASQINSASSHRINLQNNSTYGDGYFSRLCFVDGQALDPSSFGYLNTEINEWVSKSQSQVKAVVDAGGTNSFMLDFDNGTSLTTLGYDKSTKGNNWTLNNFSLTPGATYDWMLDVPGNSYATLNPIYPSAANITNGNLSSGTTAARGTFSSTLINSQWFVTAGASAVTAGVIDDSGTANTTSVTANKTFAFKMTTAGALSYKNVTDAGSWTSIATGLTGNRWPYSVTQAASWNFGQQPLPEALDTEFKSLCQANLPDSAIRNPRRHFDVNLRVAGGASGYTKTGMLFKPDFLASKTRAISNAHYLMDSVRGVSKSLSSNTTGAEATLSNFLTSFNNDGYTFGAGDYSTPTGNIVEWLWKAGGAPVTNTQGSITSQVSANVEAGFSIVRFDAVLDTLRTVGHGLGAAPELIIAKSLVSGTLDWYVYCDKLTSAAYYLRLNGTAAEASNNAVWGSTAPTSTVFTQGSGAWANGACIAFCFRSIPGYSKVAKATLVASADNTYIDFGFKPAMVWAKQINSTSNWYDWDAKRSPENVMDDQLFLNLANAETTSGISIDRTSQGIKVRTSAAGTYIFYAVAEVAGKFSNAV